MSDDFFSNAYSLLDFFISVVSSLFGVMADNPFLALVIILSIFGVAFELVQILIHIKSNK